jgi:hypothetical protein
MGGGRKEIFCVSGSTRFACDCRRSLHSSLSSSLMASSLQRVARRPILRATLPCTCVIIAEASLQPDMRRAMHLSIFPGGRERNLTSFSLPSGLKRHSCTSLQGNSFKVRGTNLEGLLSAGFVPLAVAAFIISRAN